MADSSTRVSLLGRLRLTPTDDEAWSEFVERYGRQVYAWCRQWGLQDEKAERDRSDNDKMGCFAREKRAAIKMQCRERSRVDRQKTKLSHQYWICPAQS